MFFFDELVLIIRLKFLLNVLTFLKYHTYCQFDTLVCISGVDYLQRSNRFEINYDLLSLRFNYRIRIKVLVNELDVVNSSGNLFNSAFWHESEIWDMYGIFFKNHFQYIQD